MFDVTSQFLQELKQYNGTNFRTLLQADLSNVTRAEYKAFSSVITRYFIFCEKHPELSDAQVNLLYYCLKLDTVARYFSQYPAASVEDLRPFQREIQLYIAEARGANDNVRESTST